MYRFKSSNYISVTALLIALIFVVGYLSHFISISSQEGIFQISDALLLSLACLIEGPMMLVVGPISGLLIDVSSDAVQYLPATIIIHFLMPLLIIMLKKIINWPYLLIFFSSFLTLVYSLYDLILFPILGFSEAEIKPLIISDLIINSIQMVITFALGAFLYWQLNLINNRSGHRIWNDTKYDYLKIKSKIN
ncbi:ECF transporter S component [Spiroplasma endosymbiont of Amphibalanus improvisus]|uniref:ECF transporter S component n=1 Tax=Spiroplasma endosymbiont of Amphibalanus improvisus TaxID=3066327 RepID=UPI00313BF9E2